MSKKIKKDQKLERVYKCKANFVETKANEEEGIIEAYVSVFGNIDSYGDIIEQGAFADSIAKKKPVGVWSHNWDQPIAKTLEVKEDNHGLYIKGQLILEVQKAKEAYALMKAGVINEFSIGFFIEEYNYDEVNEVRVIKKIKLIEWSPVIAGANPDTNLISVKSEEEPQVDESEEVEEVEEVPEEEEKEPESEEIDESEDVEDEVEEEKEEIEEEKVIEEKAGKVLSKKNRGLVEGALEVIDELQETLKNVSAPLKSLLEAADDEKGEKVEAEKQVDANVLLRIKRNAKKVDKINETILKIVK